MMKKTVMYIGVLLTLSLGACTTSYVVRERPAEVVYTRPVPPGPNHIWISGDWIWVGGRYQWREGHWERRRPNHVWIDGHWQAVHGGWRWQAGHWG